MTDVLLFVVSVLAHGSESIPDLLPRVRWFHPHLVPPARSCVSRSLSLGWRSSSFLQPCTWQLDNASSFRAFGQRCTWEPRAPACFASSAVEPYGTFIRSSQTPLPAAAPATPCLNLHGTVGEWPRADTRPFPAALLRVSAGPTSHPAQCAGRTWRGA